MNLLDEISNTVRAETRRYYSNAMNYYNYSSRALLRGWRTPFCHVVTPMRVGLGTRFSRLPVPVLPQKN